MQQLPDTVRVLLSGNHGKKMSKGTAAQGKRQKQTHLICRKCGRHAYHMRKKRCASCGFGASSKTRDYSWSKTH